MCNILILGLHKVGFFGMKNGFVYYYRSFGGDYSFETLVEVTRGWLRVIFRTLFECEHFENVLFKQINTSCSKLGRIKRSRNGRLLLTGGYHFDTP